jgi:histidinol-phosphate aminotransferase
MYEVSAAINDVRLIKIDLTGDFNIDPSSVLPHLDDPLIKLIFICSPNNPSGNCMNHTVVEDIISRFSGIVVVDEAYNDFSGKPSFRFSIGKYPNLIVMQTFSKALGLAAARIGMAFTSAEVVSYFNKMKPPYNISTINQKAALKKLQSIETYRNEVKKITLERERLMSNLKKISIIEKVFPSDANFILIKVQDADNMYEQLKSSKIIIRNRNRIAEGCLRITVGSGTENDKLITTLKTLAK